LSLQKQFEEEQADIAKESLEVITEDVGALGDIEARTTAEGVQQEGRNITANATDLPDDASNSTSTLVSCTTGRETVGQPVEVSLQILLIRICTLLNRLNVCAARLYKFPYFMIYKIDIILIS
jgi:hypothetical protein